MSASLSPRSAAANPTRRQLDELEALLQRMLDLPVNQVEPEGAPESPGQPPARDSAAPRRPLVGYTTPEPEPEAEPPAQAAAPPPAQELPPEEQAPPALGPRIIAVADMEETPPAEPPNPPPARAEPKPAKDAETWVPLRANWKPSAQTWGPLAESWQKARDTLVPSPKPPPEREPAPEPAPKMPVQILAPAPAPVPKSVAAPAVEVAPAAAPPQRRVEPAPAADRRAEPAGPPAQPAPSTDRAPLPWWAWPPALLDGAFDLVLSPWGAPGRWLRSLSAKNFLGIVGVLCLVAAAALSAADWFGWTW
jgi:nicotinate-nucleotide--dimethylbenzimidazole phosphoribosyltransferase